ncbi:hypothetical protein EIN_491320 [Entamoeba invadens IP1]|uniref:Phorbol-ester/DAG-type domain-containing protein n=1 Tax=Entamoeba invadens IP1 TaxID=370355 RepID=A0A0A1U3Z5_ENTIV|nr:hypothetical protein EIN_491320 [Entamoeba invadens IP1]ELP88963.1 hypothetical protein EIN_491320 [Entamoeba invadens IP1]|eukprot:XP_004255734.1 hypothetical protein EIN_491320 [Entamoeba invadens IP1]
MRSFRMKKTNAISAQSSPTSFSPRLSYASFENTTLFLAQHKDTQQLCSARKIADEFTMKMSEMIEEIESGILSFLKVDNKSIEEKYPFLNHPFVEGKTFDITNTEFPIPQDSFIFALRFFHLAKTFFRLLKIDKSFPLCYSAFPYTASLRSFFAYFKHNNMITKSGEEKEKHYFFNLTDKIMLLFFERNVVYLRLLMNEYNEFVDTQETLLRIQKCKSPRDYFPHEKLINTNEFYSYDFYAKEAWDVSNQICLICGTLETLRQIKKWKDRNVIEKREDIDAIIAAIKLNKWNLLKKGRVLIEGTNIFGPFCVGGELLLFDGGVLLFETKEENVEYRGWSPIENITTDQIKPFKIFNNENQCSSLVLTLNEGIAKIIGTFEDLKDWLTAIESLVKKFKVNKDQTLSLGGNTVIRRSRKFSFATPRTSISSKVSQTLSCGDFILNSEIYENITKMIQMGFLCTTQEQKKKVESLLSQIDKLLDKKSKILGKDTLAPFVNIKSKDPQSIKIVLDSIFDMKNNKENLIIVYLLLLLVYQNYTTLKESNYPEQSLLINDKLNITKLVHHISKRIGDKDATDNFCFVLEKFPHIISGVKNIFGENLITPLMLLKTQKADYITTVNHKVYIANSEGQIEIRDFDGFLLIRHKIDEGVIQITGCKECVLALTKTKMYKIGETVNKINSEPCDSFLHHNNFFFMVYPSKIGFYTVDLNPTKERNVVLKNPRCVLGSSDTVVVVCIYDNLYRVITIDQNLEFTEIEELVNNEEPTFLTSALDFVYVGTITGRVLQYMGGVLIMEKMLMCGKINGIQCMGRFLFVFGDEVPVTILYEKGLVVLYMSSLLGFEKVRCCKGSADKRVVSLCGGMRQTFVANRKTSSSRSVTNNCVKERVSEFFGMTPDGNLGKFSGINFHRKEDILKDKNAFVVKRHKHVFYRKQVCCGVCDMCMGAVVGNVIGCRLCFKTYHEGCVNVAALFDDCLN